MRVLLLIPPMTQLNTPYPATAYLTGFLRGRGVDAVQADPAIELVLRLFSRDGVRRIGEILAARAGSAEKARSRGSRGGARRGAKPPAAIASFLAQRERYAECVDAAVRFLQGRDPSLALRIVGREFLPEGPRFGALESAALPAEPEMAPDTATGRTYQDAALPAQPEMAPGTATERTYQDAALPAQPVAAPSSLSEGETATMAVSYNDPIAWAFGSLGVQDRAKYLASLFIDDLADVIREGIDPRFELSRYGEKLAASAPSFEPLLEALEDEEPTLVDETLDRITEELLDRHRPDVLGLTVPFPGNVYGAFRVARRARKLRPDLKIVLGGGYVNTELRELKDPRVFDYVDFVTLDDGERPFLCVLEHLEGKRPVSSLFRTFVREAGRVALKHDPKLHDIPHRDCGTPCYDGLPLSSYLSIFEMLNPMHRIWSDGRWNKLTLAHGCYWKKCNFCDVTLDYIGRYDPASADLLVDRIEAVVRETGQSGFHFVDEAAPPAVLRALAERLLERGVTITWWGNVRFEKTFTPELARLLARSGCVAVSGGLEVASDRLLKLMQKGVTVEQVARVTRAFTDAGVMVHAYLMYGFPTQTEQETIDALERVRQLFEAGCIQSAYWHRFSATAHSPIGRDPAKFGIRLLPEPEVTFARNDLAFEDPTGCDHEAMGAGLRKALYNYMHGLGLEMDVRFWFEKKVPKARVPRNLVARALESAEGEPKRAGR